MSMPSYGVRSRAAPHDGHVIPAAVAVAAGGTPAARSCGPATAEAIAANGGAAAVLVQFLALNMWGRISDVFGNRLILVTTGSFIPLLPAMWLVSETFWYLTTIQVVSGFVWAGFSLSAGNFLYDLVPSQRRTRYMALHNVFIALAIFGGGMLGALLSRSLRPLMELIGLHWTWDSSVLLGVFAVSALLRALVVVVFLPHLEEVRKPRRAMSARQLVFRVTRFNAFSGLLYEVVSTFKRQPADRDN